MPQVVTQGASRKYGLEALTYNAQTHRFWTVSESTLKGDGEQATPENGAKNKLRLLTFDDSLTLKGQYFYEMDAPEAELASSQYAMGVSALAALDNGQLLVLEREFCVAPSKIGSTVQCRIYRVTPTAGDIMPATASIQGKKPWRNNWWRNGTRPSDCSVSRLPTMRACAWGQNCRMADRCWCSFPILKISMQGSCRIGSGPSSSNDVVYACWL